MILFINVDNTRVQSFSYNSVVKKTLLKFFSFQQIQQIDYVVGSFDFHTLSELGLNVSNEIVARNSIPNHVTTASDLFCNRELNMQQIKVIGFDMDWTLATYNKEFDLLAYNGAKEKLHSLFKFPVEVLDLEYNNEMCRRGCIIDKKKGNILKLDQHKYVREAEHGLTRLSRDDRKSIYKQSYQESETFSGSDFVNIDTPFSLVDACLYLQLVDLKDKLDATNQFSVINKKSYSQLWSEMRKCVDRCHKDGVIKHTVAKNPSKYIDYDPYCFI
jgi:HAD superfamily 5'-nucleotidase-like hydrolase